MIPVVLVSKPLMDILAVTPILLANVMLQCWVKPWCTQSANLVDVVGTRLIGLCVTFAVSWASFELRFTGQVEEEEGGLLFASGFTTCSVLAAGSQAAEREETVWGRFVPPEMGAGMLARFIKLSMQRSIRGGEAPPPSWPGGTLHLPQFQ